ncbi:MAG: phosphate acyltransferase, partial [Dolichospermum sp.]
MGSTGVRIAIDAMGGDHAPDEIVAGALRAREELGVKILLVGDPQRIEAVIPPKTNMADLEIVTAKEAIAMDEEPLNAVRRKRESSINIAMDLVKN